MAGIGWAPLGGEWWTWQWCVSIGVWARLLRIILIKNCPTHVPLWPQSGTKPGGERERRPAPT
jgi:hypothetical protein